MKTCLQSTLFMILIALVASDATAQSALDGTTFQASTFNMPDSVGTVRLIDTAGSNCRVEGGPVGDDRPSADVCFTETAALPSVSLTFNAGVQAVGGALVTPTVVPFAGLTDAIEVFNAATDTTAPLDWSRPGDLLEFTVRTPNDSFPATDDENFWGFSATEIQYPNASADSEVGIPFDEAIGNYTNFYFWFEDKDGPITAGYDIVLPVGLGVGHHPLDPDREVLYPLYSVGQADEQVDTVAGGSLDFFSHGSVLDSDPGIGNILFLADRTIDANLDALQSVTGMGLALLIQPPELATTGVTGDFDDDGLLTATDIDLLSAQVGGADLSFDLNEDGSITDADRTVWIADLAGTLTGDADLNRTVEFADFLSLSAAFGKAGGWADGDFDGSGDVQFADFLQLSGNFGKTTGEAAASVPEPSACLLLIVGIAAMGAKRQRRVRS